MLSINPTNRLTYKYTICIVLFDINSVVVCFAWENMPEIHLIVVLFSPKTLEAFFVYILSQHAVNWFCCAQACPVKHEQNQDAMETAPPPFCFWHLNPCKAKSNQEMQHISRIDPGQCFPPRISARAVISDRSLCRDRTISSRFRQVPRHMLALVAQLLSSANISHCSSENRFWNVFTTPLRSIKYVHVPLELRDFALFGGLETWSIPIRLDWRKSFSCWTAAFWTAAFKVWGKMKRCKAEGVSKFENEESMKLAELAEDSSWCPFFLHTCEDWSLNTKSEHGFTARRTFALASKWNGHCSQPYLPVSGTYSKSKPKQTASQDLTEKTAGPDRFHLICSHL